MRQNSQTSSGPWKWAFSRPGTWRRVRAHGAGSPTQHYDFFAEQTLKISVYFMQRIKSYSIFTARQTHRQTDRCTFCIPICTGEIFSIWKFIPFTTLCSFVRFAHSLTSFVKAGILINCNKNFIFNNFFKSLDDITISKALPNVKDVSRFRA